MGSSGDVGSGGERLELVFYSSTRVKTSVGLGEQRERKCLWQNMY